MTPRTWAEDKVSQAQRRYPNANTLNIAAYVAGQEHARAVRIVKRYIRQYAADRDLIERTVAQNILAALQRGRTGRGRIQ